MDVMLKSGKLPIRACHDTLSPNDKKNLNFILNILIGHSVSDLCKEKKYSDVT